MNNIQKLMIAVAGFFIVGFMLVGSNKTQTDEQKEAAAMIRAVSSMQTMASKKCPALIKKHTGTQITSLVSGTDTDRATFLTLEWLGEEGYNFNKATCTLRVSLGGISKLIIDGKTIIDKE